MAEILRTYQYIVICLIVIVLFIIPYSLFHYDLHAEEVRSPNAETLKVRAVKDYVNKLEIKIASLEKPAVLSGIDPHLGRASAPKPHGDLIPASKFVRAPSPSPPAPVSNSAPIQSIADVQIIQSIDPDFETWKQGLDKKLRCKDVRGVLYYHYHTRKAAGTSIRECIRMSARLSGISYVETEGLVLLDSSILSEKGVMSITSLRDPVERILSLYWYEHVGWHAGILKKPEQCRTMQEWIQAWSDGGKLKSTILSANPLTNYIEIENYYVKMLSGWDGVTLPLTTDHLEKAKGVLRKFDMVLISEWLGDETQLDAFNAVFKGRGKVSLGHKVGGDRKMREKLKDKLAANETDLREQLRRLNTLDIQLFEYAQSLVALRLKEVLRMVQSPQPHTAHIPIAVARKQCIDEGLGVIHKYKRYFGVFQPKGHKGP
eukprot:gene27526-33248_t